MENERLVTRRWRTFKDSDLLLRSLAGTLTDEEFEACSFEVIQHNAQCQPGVLKLHADGRIEQITVESVHPSGGTVLVISELAES